jgi:predicted outer membrane repeat protein
VRGNPQSFDIVTILMIRQFISFCAICLLLVVGGVEPFTHLVSAKTIYIPENYDSIQEGISKAQDGDTVLVAKGTYYENINFLGKKIVLASHFILKGDTAIISKTILDGSKADNKDSASVVMFISGEDSSSVIIGFTIQNGSGVLILKPNGYGGGGITCKSSSPWIIQNVVKNNSAYSYGGGIYCQDGSPQIIQNVIMENNTNYFGAGIFCSKASAKIEGNILQSNSAQYGRGGGIHSYASTPLIKRNLILENTCYLEGGGVCCESSSALIINNTLVKNQTIGGNGIGCIRSSSPKIINNIISFGKGSAGMWCDESSHPFVSHNDFWKNSSEIYGSCKPSADNLFLDPLFVNPLESNYHLKKDSPLIDAGDTTSIEKDPD